MRSRCFILGALVWAVAPVLLYAMESEGADSLELRPGVIVDLEKERVYLMSPERSVEAVGFARGETLWSSSSAAKPLAKSGSLVVCQADTAEAASDLNLVVLDDEQQGRQVTASTVSLPGQVAARIDDSLTSRFRTRAVAVPDGSIVSWEYQVVPMRGMPPPEEGAPVAEAFAGVPTRSSGAVSVDLRTGRVAPVEPQNLPRALRAPGIASAIPTVAGRPDPTQRLSADGHHTLKAKRIADDREWEKYEWSIVENETGNEIGKLKSHLSQVPFVVKGSLILFETGPFARRADAQMEEQPLAIRAVDLATGEQRWSRPVRDTAFAGPFPP
jgi:hypothetical protein